MKKLPIILCLLGGCVAQASASSFQFLNSWANTKVNSSQSGNGSYSETNYASSGYSEYASGFGDGQYGSSSQTTTIAAGSGVNSSAVITSAASTVMAAGYAGQASSSTYIKFNVYEATAYRFGSFDFSKSSSAGSKVRLYMSGGNTAFQKNFGAAGNYTSGLQEGVLEAGTYWLVVENFSNGTSWTGSTNVSASASQFNLDLGGAAGVPEAGEGICLLAGSMMFLFAGSRRRRAKRSID